MVNINPRGMTDGELEAACIRSPFEIRHSYSWTAEVYSFGKCLREAARYPKMFPLYVYSDHGAALHSNLFPHELNNGCSVHLTWHPDKAAKNPASKKKLIHIEHPWISYRRLKGFRRADSTSGTLVFYTHTVPGVKLEGCGGEEYFDRLRALPPEFHPVVLCLHMHDIKSGLYKTLRRHGFPIVTAGNTSADDFVDNFYKLVSGFSYASSQEWGSQLAYCVELGVPYFLLGRVPRLINLSHTEMPLGMVDEYQDDDHRRYMETARQLFSYPSVSLTREKTDFIENILGMRSGVKPADLGGIIWGEFFRNWRKWYLVPQAMLLTAARVVFSGTLEMIYRWRMRNN